MAATATGANTDTGTKTDSGTSTATGTGTGRRLVSARASAAPLLAGVGILLVAVSVVAIGVLHFVPPTNQISWKTRTISEYGLTDLAWAFNVGVLALVAGSLAVFAAAAVRRWLRPTAAVFGLLWMAGLSTLVVFTKHNYALADAGGHSGTIHRAASLVAFLSLPVAVLALVRGHRTLSARIARGLAVLSLLWFAPILWAILLSGQRSWWMAIPLGLVERGLALTEVITVIAVAVWVARRRADQMPSGTMIAARSANSV